VGLSDRAANVTFSLLLFAVAASMAWEQWKHRASRRASPGDER
jgi:hypothetical protein